MRWLDPTRKNELMVNALKRNRNTLAMDSARPNSVGAPGGLLGHVPDQQRRNYLRDGLLGASFLPGIGDAAGLLSDAHMYATEPGSRTPTNYLLSGLGALPMFPSAGMLRQVDDTLYRGGRAPNDGQFFSRDPEYAKGFDKGHYGKYRVMARNALSFGTPVNADDMAGTLAAMRADGDNKAADMIEQALLEDGHVMAEDVYTWMRRLGKAAPEQYLKRGGIDAIDTGRDVRALSQSVAQPYSN